MPIDPNALVRALGGELAGFQQGQIQNRDREAEARQMLLVEQLRKAQIEELRQAAEVRAERERRLQKEAIQRAEAANRQAEEIRQDRIRENKIDTIDTQTTQGDANYYRGKYPDLVGLSDEEAINRGRARDVSELIVGRSTESRGTTRESFLDSAAFRTIRDRANQELAGLDVNDRTARGRAINAAIGELGAGLTEDQLRWADEALRIDPTARLRTETSRGQSTFNPRETQRQVQAEVERLNQNGGTFGPPAEAEQAATGGPAPDEVLIELLDQFGDDEAAIRAELVRRGFDPDA